MKKNILSIILFLILASMVVLIMIHYTNKEPTYQNSVSFNEKIDETPTYVEPTYEKDITFSIKKNIPIIVYSGIALITFSIVIFIFLARKKEW